MAFPESIIYKREISPEIKQQNIDDILNLIEKECQNHGNLIFTRDDSTLTFRRKYFVIGTRSSGSLFLFETIDYGTVQIDLSVHTITFNFYTDKTAALYLGGVGISITMFIISQSFFPLIFIPMVALAVIITIYRLEKFTTKMTKAINKVFEKR